jgi:hypothetical protein
VGEKPVISATIRDIAIIIIAIQSIVIGVLIGVLIWQIWRLVRMLQSDIKPIIADLQQTMGTIRGTATFVSDNVVEPVVQTSSTMARWRATMSALTRELRPQPRPKAPVAPPPTVVVTPPPPAPPPPTPPPTVIKP